MVEADGALERGLKAGGERKGRRMASDYLRYPATTLASKDLRMVSAVLM